MERPIFTVPIARIRLPGWTRVALLPRYIACRLAAERNVSPARPRTDQAKMRMERSSEETVVVATYSNWNDAELARSFLEAQGIASFVAADEVHVPLQVTEGSRLRVLSTKADQAFEALRDADMLPEAVSTEDGAHDGESTNRLTSWTYLVIILLLLAGLLIKIF